MKTFFLLISIFFFSCESDNPPSLKFVSEKTQKSERSVGGACECCEAWKDGLPKKLNWETQISPNGEPGEPLEISGTIFQNDGKTPASGIILYVYHTDAEGKYSRGPDYSNCAKRHGLLRGWMKTGEDGKYSFKTIRPASYPNTTIEQHIHPIIKEPGLREYWIDEFVFEDDPNLNEEAINRYGKRGGSGVIKLTKNKGGIWEGKRDIVLGKNVPGY